MAEDIKVAVVVSVPDEQDFQPPPTVASSTQIVRYRERGSEEGESQDRIQVTVSISIPYPQNRHWHPVRTSTEHSRTLDVPVPSRGCGSRGDSPIAPLVHLSTPSSGLSLHPAALAQHTASAEQPLAPLTSRNDVVAEDSASSSGATHGSQSTAAPEPSKRSTVPAGSAAGLEKKAGVTEAAWSWLPRRSLDYPENFFPAPRSSPVGPGTAENTYPHSSSVQSKLGSPSAKSGADRAKGGTDSEERTEEQCETGNRGEAARQEYSGGASEESTEDESEESGEEGSDQSNKQSSEEDTEDSSGESSEEGDHGTHKCGRSSHALRTRYPATPHPSFTSPEGHHRQTTRSRLPADDDSEEGNEESSKKGSDDSRDEHSDGRSDGGSDENSDGSSDERGGECSGEGSEDGNDDTPDYGSSSSSHVLRARSPENTHSSLASPQGHHRQTSRSRLPAAYIMDAPAPQLMGSLPDTPLFNHRASVLWETARNRAFNDLEDAAQEHGVNTVGYEKEEEEIYADLKSFRSGILGALKRGWTPPGPTGWNQIDSSL